MNLWPHALNCSLVPKYYMEASLNYTQTPWVINEGYHKGKTINAC
jgi:hypothetical protein